uniref:NADH dehydrogenase subunit 6 n=1 Tax=Monodonta labio TaxID=74046 RepID=A0A650GA30_9VEST|nr:NADH dehydrogenase subunit 6 [Monodonta labio]
MSVMVVLSLCFSLMFMMPGMLQPLSLGLCVMSLSVGFCVLIGLSLASWYGYVLFLVYVGGLLVMFAYVSALAPNNFFSSAKMVGGFCFVFLIGLGMAGTLYFAEIVGLGGTVVEFGEFKGMSASGKMVVSPSSMVLIIVLGVVLLINLLAVVKVCYYQQGPLRAHSELK